MFLLIAILIGLLPFLITCIRNPGWIASILVAILCFVFGFVLFMAGWQAAAIPWALSLLIACAATGGRELNSRRQHAELMKALADKKAASGSSQGTSAVDRFIKGGGN